MMGYYEYIKSRQLAARACEGPGNEFYSLLMAAMRCADTDNLNKLAAHFPDVRADLVARYNAPGGLLPGETEVENG